MKFGVVIFPGSNCDKDMIHVLRNVCQQEVIEIWHKDAELKNINKNDCIVLPGGFSYGDYLRSGALASHSNIMKQIKQHAENGGFVLGVCNGFQILCESGLLPGALLHNNSQLFICKDVYLKVGTQQSAITKHLPENSVLRIPIAHGEGNYYANAETIEQLKQNNQILFYYCNKNGEIDSDSNPNGSLLNIAGISNKTRNVFGMMPHPERCSESILGNSDGLLLFQSIIKEMQAESVL